MAPELYSLSTNDSKQCTACFKQSRFTGLFCIHYQLICTSALQGGVTDIFIRTCQHPLSSFSALLPSFQGIAPSSFQWTGPRAMAIGPALRQKTNQLTNQPTNTSTKQAGCGSSLLWLQWLAQGCTCDPSWANQSCSWGFLYFELEEWAFSS